MFFRLPLLAAVNLLLAILVSGFNVNAFGANLPRAATQENLASNLQQLSTSQATQELQNGFGKLMRMCTYASGSSATTQRQSFEFWSTQSAQAQSKLIRVQQEVDEIARNFAQNSRNGKYGMCPYMPALLPLNWACEGYRHDSQAFQKALSQAQKVILEARQRMGLYEKFSRLEDQGCVRPGFTMKLWDTEQNHLWPSVMRLTPALKSSLPYAKPD